MELLLRYQIFLAYGCAFGAIWLYGIRNIDKLELPEVGNVIVVYAPVWGVLFLGIYLLSRLVLGVFSFRDCPDAAKEIEMQIAEARNAMKARKIIL